MPPESKYIGLPPRSKRYPYLIATSPLTRGSRTPRLSKHSAEVPTWSGAYPDANVSEDEPITVDTPQPDEVYPKVASPPLNRRQTPPRLQKSNNTPTGYRPTGDMPQMHPAAPPPPRVPLSQSFTMQPEHEYNRPAAKHRSARRRTSFDDDFQYYYREPIQTKTTYRVGNREGIPRIIDTKEHAYDRDNYGATSRGYWEDVEDYNGATSRASEWDVEDYSITVEETRSPSPRRHPSMLDSNSDSDSDSVSDDGSEVSMPDKSRTSAMSPRSPSDSGMSARLGGVSRGRQSFRPLNARRLAGVANRDTISKDNTNGEEAREEELLANMYWKICKTPQQAVKLPAGNGERWNRDSIVRR